jgi:enoyl-CoA hydratase/carnithine racemase
MRRLKTVLYRKKDFVARVTINRPDARNGINSQLVEDLLSAMDEARGDTSVGVVVITGAGDKIFCPGLDLVYAQTLFGDMDEVWRLNNGFSRVIYDIRHMGKPVIARINGITAGGGCELLLACDLAISAEHATFKQGAGGLGVVPVHATQSLTPIMGDKRARWFLFTDEVVDAKTALDYGLINRVVPYDKLDEEVDGLCHNLLNKAPWCLRFAKDQMNVWFEMVYHTMHEGNDFSSLQSTTPEPLEGITAFLEKRTPDYVALRRKAATGRSHTYLWGPPTKTCPDCSAKWLPSDFEFCGRCGAKLT